jgi:hypothetical protein
MRRLRAVILAVVVSVAMFVLVVPGAKAATSNTLTVRGLGRYAHLVVPGNYGYLDHIEVYYSADQYIHEDDGLARDPRDHIRDLRLWTCVNGTPCHGAPTPNGDRILTYDVDNPGTLGQPYCNCNQNLHLRYTPPGYGMFLTESHYEHGGVPRIEWVYTSGREVDTVFPDNPHLFGVNIQRPWTGPLGLTLDNVDLR